MQHGAFLFGASTSAHQIEGGNTNNDWWEWERSRPLLVRSNKAADSWNRYEEDIAIMKQLGHTAHRLSLEWSRIETKEGAFNTVAIAHYRAVLKELHANGIQTFVTLHHFTNPTWLAQRGGWESAKTPELFARYTKYVAQHLGDYVDFWITINEPVVYALQSYKHGIWPPNKTNIFSTWRVIRNLARAHMLAYRSLHQVTPHIPVGLAKHFIAYMPRVRNWLFNYLFFFLIRNTQDFIGVNYYFCDKSYGESLPTSDMGWPICPEGLTHILLSLKKYKKPLYVTENGIADAADSRRGDYIRSHIRAIEEAQKQDCDVRGYLHWSLIDNFEWADGFTPRFGLVAVDFTTFKRTIRPSAFIYKAIIEQSKGVV